MPHLDDTQRTWQVALTPPEATTRLADLLRAYGWQVTLQSDDFVAAERRSRVRTALLAAGLLLLPLGALAVWALRRPAEVITAESLQDGLGAEVTVTSTGLEGRALACDLAHGLDVDRRPVAVP